MCSGLLITHSSVEARWIWHAQGWPARWNSALLITGGGRVSLLGQPLRETNGEAAVRAGARLELELELSTDLSSVWEDLVAAFGQGRPNN